MPDIESTHIGNPADSEVRDWFYANGWEAFQESWYDEEGIEAWRWMHPDHEEEFADMGDWDKLPPVTEDMMAFMDAARMTPPDKCNTDASEPDAGVQD